MDMYPNQNGRKGVAGLNSIEMDTIGEILNISMGAAATAVSILLNRQVVITTPSVKIEQSSEFEFVRLEPAYGIEIKYVDGLFGSNHMIMSVRDIKAIVQLLLGGDGSEPLGDEPLDEIHISALGEVMNQMMGASCTALASFLNREINISPPVPFEISSETERQIWAEQEDDIVSVSFKLTIEGLVDSEFYTVMSVPFAKDLVTSAMGEMREQEEQMPVQINSPQVTGHMQVPMPILSDDYQAAMASSARTAPAPAPKPAPAPAQVAAPAPAARPAPAPAARQAAPAGYPERAASHQNVVVKPLQFGNLDTEDSYAEDIDSVTLGLVMGVDLNVTVEIGRTRKQVKEILALRQGSILELDKQAGEPVDIMVNGKLIARGDVVVIDDNFGVRITEIAGSGFKR